MTDIYKALSALNLRTKSLSFNSSTTESLKNSGDIGLIPSEIRNKLNKLTSTTKPESEQNLKELLEMDDIDRKKNASEKPKKKKN
mgnify:CR=1 FL=1